MAALLALDPAVGAALRGGLALLLAAAALHKLRGPAEFRADFEAYGLLPAAAAPFAAALVAPAELAAAVALAAPATAAAGFPLAEVALGGAARAAGPLLAAVILAVYGAAMAVALARGRRDLDCGCLGPGRRQPLSGWLVARNAALVAVALACLLPRAARPLVALDALTAAAAVTFAAVLWSGAHQALANAARGASMAAEVGR